MSDKPHSNETFMKFFSVADKIRQNVLKTSTKKNVALIESLSFRQQKTLMTVHIMTREVPEGVSLKQLAKRLNMTIPATSVLVESLVQSKLILRETNQLDRRAVRIKMSPYGGNMFEAFRVKAEQDIRELVGEMDPNDKIVFDRIIDQFYQKLFIQECPCASKRDDSED